MLGVSRKRAPANNLSRTGSHRVGGRGEAGSTLLRMAAEPGFAKLRSQRGAPPYFAGRAEELGLLDKRLDDLLETADPTEGMSLIVGVPGVGKTQLARAFASRAVGRDGEPEVRHLLLDTNMLASPVDLLLAMGDSLDEEAAFRSAVEMDSRATGVAGAVGPIKADVKLEHARHAGGVTAALRKTRSSGAWHGKALVMVVDELQTVDAAGMAQLRALHEGAHGCPTLLVGVGLQHTPTVLANPSGAPGISRLAQTIQLRPLSEADALDAITGSMSALGHDIPAACTAALAAASHGFPQHIHGYLAGALQAIGDHGCLREGPALQAALAAGHRARLGYYDERLRLLRGIRPVLALVRVMDERGTDALAIEDAIRELDQAGFKGQATIDNAIFHGVLAENPLGAVSFGIPSFHGYMRELAQTRHDQNADAPGPVSCE